MKIGKRIDDGSDFELNLPVFLKTHTLIQGMTGSGKTNLILKIVEESEKEKLDVQMIFLDDQEEFTEIPKHFKSFTMLSKDTPKSFTVAVQKINNEDVCIARLVGKQVRLLGKSVVVNLHDFTNKADRKKFVGEFLIGLESVGKQIGKHALVVIDEADQYVPSKEKLHSIATEPIIDLTKRARKQNISMVLSTQFMTEVDIRARRECHNRILGNVTELRDSRGCAEMLGDMDLKNEFFDLDTGEFFVRGKIFPKGVSRIQVDRSTITVKQAGIDMEDVKSISNSSELDNAIERNNDLTKEEYLQMKVSFLERQLEDQKKLTEEAFISGYEECDKKWQNKSTTERKITNE